MMKTHGRSKSIDVQYKSTDENAKEDGKFKSQQIFLNRKESEQIFSGTNESLDFEKKHICPYISNIDPFKAQVKKENILNKNEYMIVLNREITLLKSVANPQVILDGVGSINSEHGWSRGQIVLKKNHLILQKQEIPLQNIVKLKIINEFGNNHKIILKISTQTKDFYVIVDQLKETNITPISYTWFAKLIDLKLQAQGHDLRKNDFLEYQKLFDDKMQAKIWGIIYKKSQYLLKWQQRYTLITKKGIFSYKNYKQCTFHIDAPTIKYIWTRFDVHQNMLIIKIMHERKTQFGIPIINFSLKSPHNWLYYLYTLINPEAM